MPARMWTYVHICAHSRMWAHQRGIHKSHTFSLLSPMIPQRLETIVSCLRCELRGGAQSYRSYHIHGLVFHWEDNSGITAIPGRSLWRQITCYGTMI